MKAYYSHAKILAGSRQEKEDIAMLNALGFEVDNPYHPMYSDFWQSEGIEFGKQLIDNNEVFVFRAMPTGKIPAGVGKEVKWAKDAGKFIIELPFALTERIMSIEETVDFAKEIGR